jgi:hypothetical protein
MSKHCATINVRSNRLARLVRAYADSIISYRMIGDGRGPHGLSHEFIERRVVEASEAGMRIAKEVVATDARYRSAP